MTDTGFKAINYSVEDVGKRLKSSKKRYMWTFSINQKAHAMICDASIISSKIKITWDGQSLLSSDLNNSALFQKNFQVEGHDFVILQQASDFELRVNNKSFLYLLHQEKSALAFKS